MPVYRSKRRVLRRLVIPGALAAIVAGAAIGAAASYLRSPDTPAAHGPPANQPTRTAPTGSATPTTPATGPATTAPTTTPSQSAGSAATQADGRLLNDEGYARIRNGQYSAAIPPLRQAVTKLRGAGPADPYEAYANYNLGYALLQVGDCDGAVAPLEVANRLETSPLVDAAIRRAAACAHQGS
jgi:Flp pilus assembly protein TadD